MLRSAYGVGKMLKANGYALARAADFEYDDAFRAAMPEFLEAWEHLETDRYVPQHDGMRCRRHAVFLFDPSTGELERRASEPYIQSRESNILYGGLAREFGPIEDGMARNRCFQDTVLHDALLLAGNATAPVRINVHAVRITATRDHAGKPSPEGMHQDGFDHIAIHLVQRSPNLRGARTSVAASGGRVLAERELTGFLDSIFADDRRVWHSTSAARTDGPPGYRDVLLLSFDLA